MRGLYLTIIALLVVGCFADGDFKETEKAHAEVAAPPSIKIPNNLRMKVVLTDSFGVAAGIDLVNRQCYPLRQEQMDCSN